MSNITSFTEYFKEERDIYVQNISSYNISMTFELGNGQSTSFTLPPGRDPVNLTMTIPFKTVANSSEFRRMVNRQPQVMRLISHEEFLEYYKNQARANGLRSVDEAINASMERVANRGVTPEPSKEPEPTLAKDAAGQLLSVEEVIHPRVLHLCNQVHPTLEENQKMPAQEILNELEIVAGQLKIDDWDYVMAHGYYKSVKSYAKQQLAKSVSEAKPKKSTPKKKKQVTKEVGE